LNEKCLDFSGVLMYIALVDGASRQVLAQRHGQFQASLSEGDGAGSLTSWF
jgi:hypothetical protein